MASSVSEPLIVEWPAASRARLEALARKGIVVLRYTGCEAELLPSCNLPGAAYSYMALTRKLETVRIRNLDELWATAPLGAASLEGKLQSSGQLNVAMTIVGRYESERLRVSAGDLVGECQSATHIVTGLTAGAFRFYAGAEEKAGASVGALGATAGGRSSGSVETLAEDGEPTSCGASKPEDTRPPAQCGALLRLDIAPLSTAPRATPAAATAVPKSPLPAAPPVASIAPPVAPATASTGSAISPPTASPPPAASTPSPASTTPYEWPASEATSRLSMNCNPWCHIWVDGRSVGTSPKTTAIPPGKHIIELRKGDRTKTVTVTAIKGQTSTVHFDFTVP